MKTALIFGCGNMGSAITQGLLEKQIFPREGLTIIERRETPQTLSLEGKGVKRLDSLDQLDRVPHLVILAVKPQDAGEALDQLASKIDEKTLVISVMAGVTLEKMGRHLPKGKLIRAMPNTPSQLMMGMTAYCGGPGVDTDDLSIAQVTLGALGQALQVDNESFIDASTAISGSGPAYLFFLAESMIAAAVEFGFSESDATLLVQQTLLGAANLLDRSDETAADLRAKVTSKGGTTEAALQVFAKHEVMQHLIEGFTAAKKRSEELGA